MSVNLFNAAYYRAANSDLAAAGIITDEQLFNHFFNSGVEDGRAFSPVVNLKFYNYGNPDLAAAGLVTNRQLYDHLSTKGVAEGRLFSALVNLDYYQANNADVAAAVAGNRELAFEHLQKSGIRENRLFSPLANLKYYLGVNPDVNQATGGDRFQAFEQLKSAGIAAGQRYSLVFDPTYYQEANPDLKAANLSNQQLLEHFASFGVNEGRRSSENFDIHYYLENNADLKAAGLSYQQVLQHAMLYGWREGRPSSPNSTLNAPVQIWRQLGDDVYAPGSAQSFLNTSFGNLTVDSSGLIHVQVFSYPYSYSGSSSSSSSNVFQYDSQTGSLFGKPISLGGGFGASNTYLTALTFDSAGNGYFSNSEKFSLNSFFNSPVDPLIFATPITVGKFDRQGSRLWEQKIGGRQIQADATSDPISAGLGLAIDAGVAVDNVGNVYITGSVRGNLGGASAGDIDAWAAKYDGNGTQQWLRQLGTSEYDSSEGIAVDSLGNVYLTGTTAGNLGGTNAGGDDSKDIWVAKYDSLTGTLQWLRQLGTSDSENDVRIAADSSGNVYLTGNTIGSLGGTNAGSNDVWLAKYDSSGAVQWLRQLGTLQEDIVNSMALDSAANVYVAGTTKGSLGGTNAGGQDIWLAKYDSSGSVQWLQQQGTSADDGLSDMAVDSADSIYMTSYSSSDRFGVKYNSSGTRQWLLGSSGVVGIAVDSAGDLYTSGTTEEDGYSNGFLDKFLPISTFL